MKRPKWREEIVRDYYHNTKLLQILCLNGLNKGDGFLIISLVLKITIILKNYYFGNPQAKPVYFGFKSTATTKFLFILTNRSNASSPSLQVDVIYLYVVSRQMTQSQAWHELLIVEVKILLFHNFAVLNMAQHRHTVGIYLTKYMENKIDS